MINKSSAMDYHCFTNAPFDLLCENIAYFIDKKIQPEIGFEGDVLYRISTADCHDISAQLRSAGLDCTIHAPFQDLSLGSADQNIRQTSYNKIKKAFNLIEIFRPKAIVCHLTYEEHKHSYREESWFTNSLAGFRSLLQSAERHTTPIHIENTYEKTPSQHIKLLSALNSPYAGFCLDTGHINAFARNKWQDWLPSLSPWLSHIHIHDNLGVRDEHLAIGRGNFDFAGLLNYLKNVKTKPLITFEPHNTEEIESTITSFNQLINNL